MFGANTSKPKVVRAGRAYVTINGSTAYAIGVQMQFGRTVSRLPTLSKDQVLTVTEPQGTLTIDSLLLDKLSLPSDFTSGNGCEVGSVSVTFAPDGGCDMNPGGGFTCLNGMASAVTVSGNGSQGYIAAGFQYTFTDLQMN